MPDLPRVLITHPETAGTALVSLAVVEFWRSRGWERAAAVPADRPAESAPVAAEPTTPDKED